MEIAKAYRHLGKRDQKTNETFDFSAENFLPGNQPGDRYQTMRWRVQGAVGKESLNDNVFIVLLASIAISSLVGYWIAQPVLFLACAFQLAKYVIKVSISGALSKGIF
jgi:hypothetical protein